MTCSTTKPTDAPALNECLIAFGSNEGDRLKIFRAALQSLDSTDGIEVVAASRPLETDPVGGGGEAYLNAAIRLRTTLNPAQLHHRLIEIENQLGRIRRTRWGARKIDLDLLLFDQRKLFQADLIVPHPRMSFRRFVLQPAVEVAPDMVHSTSGKTLQELLWILDHGENRVVGVVDGPSSGLMERIQLPVARRFSDWKFSVVDDPNFESISSGLAKPIKLVVFFDDNHNQQTNLTGSPGEHFRAAMSHPGPTLILPRDEVSGATELMAAVEAMQNL